MITPASGLRKGREFTTRVIYGGHVNYVNDPDHSKDGWIPTDDGAYVNFLVDEGESRIRDAYPGKTWDRLRAVKRRYDPTNLFRINQNIPPAG